MDQVLDLQGTLTFARKRVYHMGYQKPLYLTTKRDVFYYTRRVPQSLKAEFQSPRFVKCLHTKSEKKLLPFRRNSLAVWKTIGIE